MKEIFNNKYLLASIIALIILVAYAYFQGVSVSATQLSEQYPDKLDAQTAFDIDSAIAQDGKADIIVEFRDAYSISKTLQDVKVQQFQIGGYANNYIRGNSTVSAIRTFLMDDAVTRVYYNYRVGLG